MTAAPLRVLCLAVLLGACASAAPSPRAAKPTPPAFAVITPRTDPGHSILVYRPDTSAVEKMPVFRPDSVIDRKMVWRGSTFPLRFRIEGKSPPDSAKPEPR